MCSVWLTFQKATPCVSSQWPRGSEKSTEKKCFSSSILQLNLWLSFTTDCDIVHKFTFSLSILFPQFFWIFFKFFCDDLLRLNDYDSNYTKEWVAMGLNFSIVCMKTVNDMKLIRVILTLINYHEKEMANDVSVMNISLSSRCHKS